MFKTKEKYLSWNPRAKRYVLTIEGEKGVKGMLNEPFEGAIMKNCTGQEHIELHNEKNSDNEIITETEKEDIETDHQDFFDRFFGDD